MYLPYNTKSPADFYINLTGDFSPLENGPPTNFKSESNCGNHGTRGI